MIKPKRLIGLIVVTILFGGAYVYLIPSPTRYNLVYISLDTVRRDALGIYGNKRPNASPAIDQFFKRGYVFDDVLSNSGFTNESHMSVFTGLYPNRHGVYNWSNSQPLDPSTPTLAEKLQSNGYETLYMGRLFDSVVLSPELGFARGFEVYTSEHGKGGKREADFLAQWFGYKRKKPFFLFVHSWRPHSPYLVPASKHPPELSRLITTQEKFFKQAEQGIHDGENPRCQKTINCLYDNFPWNTFLRNNLYDRFFFRKIQPDVASHIDELREAYGNAVAYGDDLVGEIIEQLDRSGNLENSIVIVASDHGEEFMEHGGLLHFYLNRATLEVPLLIYLPTSFKALPPQRFGRRLELVDLHPTIVELLGVEDDSPSNGISFAGIFWGKKLEEKGLRFASQRRGAREHDYQLEWNNLLLRTRNGVSIEYYDLLKDPLQKRNLVHEIKPNDLNLLKMKAEMHKLVGEVIL